MKPRTRDLWNDVHFRLESPGKMYLRRDGEAPHMADPAKRYGMKAGLSKAPLQMGWFGGEWFGKPGWFG